MAQLNLMFGILQARRSWEGLEMDTSNKYLNLITIALVEIAVLSCLMSVQELPTKMYLSGTRT